MVEIKRTIQVPATTREIVDRTICDLCGQEIKPAGNYEVSEIEVSHKSGNAYPEGGSGDFLSFDLCPKCFDEKLVPWLRSQGAVREVQAWDW